jgi:hypothetical protein
MRQHIGNASVKATTWVKRIMLSSSPQVKRARELEEFTERLRSLFDLGEPLDGLTRRLMEGFFGYNLGEAYIHRNYQAEETSRQLGARAFTFKGHIFASHQNLDTSTREGLGLLAHELTHVIQQTQPHRLPQRQIADREGSSVLAPSRGRSDVEMVLLAPANNSLATINLELGERQAQVNEQLMAQAPADRSKSPKIDAEAVADKVYRLMQYDLVLNQERATELGG